MIITVCIGSSCHLKGSREIVTKLEQLISEENLKDKIDLIGSFCVGHCVKGVCVQIDNDLFSLSPADTNVFFRNEVMRRLI